MPARAPNTLMLRNGRVRDVSNSVELGKSVEEVRPPLSESIWRAAYDDLQQLARARLGASRRDLTLLDTHALINECYLRLDRAGTALPENRGQFFAYASRVMRSVIVDTVRRRLAERRGGGATHVTLNTLIAGSISEDEPVQIDEALSMLEHMEPRLAQVVEMRYFGGLTETEIADALGLTSRTVRRDWEKARVLLKAMLSR